ncbi:MULTISPECIES: hypothetical protein [unclassified Sphingobacterium]|uniref:hypothetical protein n=1 Tax=unclassified Sphingobacterium TaxID=2609468 RepID=UPI0025EE897A|nr:hypothetical protein [Sphingobacterium sp. UBA5670]
MKLFIPLALFSLFIILIISCAKNDNTGGESAGASGSFIGRVQYQDNTLDVDRDNRLIRVLQVSGNTYKIEFYTGIPNITDLVLNKTNDSTWASTDSTGLKNVKIEGKLLTINYQSNSQAWIVNEAVRK